MNSQIENLNALISDADGFVLIFLRNGKLESRLSGNTREIFDRLFDSPEQKTTSRQCCGNCSCAHKQE